MRKLATAAAVSLVLATGGARALGLGEIEMRSALNQPMDAEIRLTSVRAGETDGMLVQLASPDAFARAGIDRSSVLTDLEFSVEQTNAGPVIRISSDRPILEPFLNFLLEVDWPQGRMVREYTVLLDPPVFMTPNATARNDTGDVPVQTQDDNSLSAPAPIARQSRSDEVSGEAAGTSAEAQSATDAATAATGQDPDRSADRATTGDAITLTDSSAASTARLDAAEINRRQRQADAATVPPVEQYGGPREVPDEFVARDILEPDGASVQEPTPDGTDASAAAEGTLGAGATPRMAAANEAGQTERQAASGRPAASLESPSSVTVQRGDTLFEIAQRTRVPAVSTQQMMLALLNANETAFINRNINLVLAGSILRVPSATEQGALSQAEALAEISKQDDLWREYRDGLRGGGATAVAGTTPPGDADAAADELAATEDPQLSGEAQAILDRARAELQDRNELQIVADDKPSSTAASATADETAAGDADRLGDINRELRLAREELASTRLEGDDLSDAQAELLSTSENLDALVSLRQNEVAALEAQLAKAREAEQAVNEDPSELAAGVAGDADDASGQAAGTQADSDASSGDASNAETDATSAAVTPKLTGDAAEGLAAATRDTIDIDPTAPLPTPLDNDFQTADATAAANGQASEPAAQNGDQTSSDTAEIAPPVRQAAWYEAWLTDQNKLIAAGVGGLGLLALIALLVRRRRHDDDFDELADIEHIDEDEADRLQGDRDDAHTAAGAVAVPAAAAADASAENAVLAVDQDKLLSEADVYVAYGLHGQAEELLDKAIADEPDNPIYIVKKLEVYHAQANSDDFTRLAAEYHDRFGGSASPHWAEVAALGAALEPGNALYRASAGSPPSAAAMTPLTGIGSTGSPLPGGASEEVPVAHASANDMSNIAGGSADVDASSDTDHDSADPAPLSADEVAVDETALMDATLDPAFAFDEADLEATGDFTRAAEGLAGDEATVDIADVGDDVAPAAAFDDSDSGSIDFPDVEPHANEATIGSTPAEAVMQTPPEAEKTQEELDLSAPIADDLTLDIDSLSDDVDFDTHELLSEDYLSVDDLKLSELDADNDSLLDATPDSVGDADDMDTMMDLAKAYIDMGDRDSASNTLDEIVKAGNPEQVSEAETLLRKIS